MLPKSACHIKFQTHSHFTGTKMTFLRAQTLHSIYFYRVCYKESYSPSTWAPLCKHQLQPKYPLNCTMFCINALAGASANLQSEDKHQTFSDMWGLSQSYVLLHMHIVITSVIWTWAGIKESPQPSSPERSLNFTMNLDTERGLCHYHFAATWLWGNIHLLVCAQIVFSFLCFFSTCRLVNWVRSTLVNFPAFLSCLSPLLGIFRIIPTLNCNQLQFSLMLHLILAYFVLGRCEIALPSNVNWYNLLKPWKAMH